MGLQRKGKKNLSRQNRVVDKDEEIECLRYTEKPKNSWKMIHVTQVLFFPSMLTLYRNP